MYEDNLYLSTLYEYLETEVGLPPGKAVRGPHPEDGVRFEDVSFAYPGSDSPALEHITLQLVPGTSLALVGENGSGKTTLIKLLTRLYAPTSGSASLLDGPRRPLADVGRGGPLRERIGTIIFQELRPLPEGCWSGENVGAGDERYFDDEERWRTAAEKGRATEFIESLPSGYRTQLGKWFRDGRELSGGQWQKIALSRAFMRSRADILVLDEPTAAMDAQAEAEVFEHFRRARPRAHQLILISAPLLDWCTHGRPDRGYSTTVTSSSAAATRSSCSSTAATRTCSRCRRAATAEGYWAALSAAFCACMSARICWKLTGRISEIGQR